MSLFEKSLILGSLATVGLASVYAMFAPSKYKINKEEAKLKR
jgi:hypothetical protein